MPLEATGKRVLLVGMGPAGFTLAHHLMNDGHTVVGIDGHLAPVPADRLAPEALRARFLAPPAWEPEILAERRRYEERIRALFREGRELGELRSDLDDTTAALLALSASNWAYTWLRPGRDTDELADHFYDLLLNGMRGYATPD